MGMIRGLKKKTYKSTYKSSKKPLILGILIVILIVLLAGVYIVQKYKVRTVYVEGNVHYTDEEIQKIVMDGKYGNNSIFLSIKYKNKGIQNIPFVETMDVTIIDPNTIKITVYEKALAGYVEYLGRYMYFDKDGIIVESSGEKTAGIPQVTGLEFGYVVLYEKLPVEDQTIFKKVLNITQLLTKYSISADKIYFDSTYRMTLYFSEARVSIGNEDFLDEKIMKLRDILPQIKDKSGLLQMENYTEDTKNITFEKD